MQWRIRVADIAIARGAPHGPRTGKGINKKTHAYGDSLHTHPDEDKPEAAVCASTPGEPLARAAAGATEKPCRMASPARLQQMQCLYTDIQLYLCSAMTVCTSSGSAYFPASPRLNLEERTYIEVWLAMRGTYSALLDQLGRITGGVAVLRPHGSSARYSP